jgi:hypothetical protein
MQKALQPALFSGLLLLAAYLRVAGLSWGLSGYGHELNFQPDEFVSLRGVLQLDLLAGNIKAPGAYFEGTFNYYLWAVPQAVLKLVDKRDARLSNSINAQDQSELLYICRWMSVVFDLGTIIIVFLAIRQATQSFYPSLLGTLCYAILPMQVIYAHFMRPHTLSNLLCALVIWLSLKLRKSQGWQLLLSVGLISGLGAAARYPVGIIVVIPCLYLLFKNAENLPNWKTRLLERSKSLIAGPVWLIGLGFLIGLFLGHPMLFLDSSSVVKAITGETLKYASLQEFSPSQLANLVVIWRYIDYVIPFAMYPVMWLLPYCAIGYLAFRRKLYSLALPLLIFSLLYLYLMGKGYLGPYFARVTMLLFPGFCVLIGIAFADLHLPLRHRRLFVAVAGCALVVVLGLSVLFDFAYDSAMQQEDARQVVREDLRNLIGDTAATIGVSQIATYFYTAMPAAKPLTSDKVAVRSQKAGESADFFLVGFPKEVQSALLSRFVRQVEAQGKFTYEKTYHVPVKIFGYEYTLAAFPQDMTYPFPTILLFRAKLQHQSSTG